jgi:DNA-binding transcriptional ArsR family regulator
MGDDCHDSSASDYRPTPIEWMQTIRRANIHPERKAACLIIATYANVADNPGKGKVCGEGICPGVDRLALDLRRSVATARRHLEWMRDVGLIVLIRRGNRRRRQSDEYRLALSEDALAKAEIPDPDEYKDLIGCARQSDRDRHKVRRAARRQDGAAEPITAQLVSGKESITAQSGTALPLTMSERPPIHADTDHVCITDHEAADLRTDLTLPRARDREQEDQSIVSPPQPDKPPTGDRPTRPCPPGLGWCVECHAATGQAVLAADAVSGSHCATHLRTRLPLKAA